MDFIRKANQRRCILVLVLLCFGGCAVTPPQQPLIEPVDRDAIKAALKEELRPLPPGPRCNGASTSPWRPAAVDDGAIDQVAV